MTDHSFAANLHQGHWRPCVQRNFSELWSYAFSTIFLAFFGLRRIHLGANLRQRHAQGPRDAPQRQERDITRASLHIRHIGAMHSRPLGQVSLRPVQGFSPGPHIGAEGLKQRGFELGIHMLFRFAGRLCPVKLSRNY